MDNKKLKDNTTETQHDQPSENWSGFSFVFSIFLPLTGLAIFFKQKHILSKLLLQLDRNCVSVFCPSLSHREKLLRWAGSRLPETWSSHSRTLAGGVAELWSDGSLLCTLINSVIPGACPNPHRHWKKPPLHAQAIAYKYLGVIPIFTDDDLSGSLTISLERNFLHYLNELQQAMAKLSERNDTPKSISLHYIVRGMGLYSGEQHRKTVFYVYPNTNAAGHNSNILVHIRGPYATYGKAVIPKFHNDLFTTPEISITSEKLTTKKLLNGNLMKPNNSFMKNFSLPFMQYHKKHMGDNIVIDVTMEEDRAKVTYIPKNYGMYEIVMISNGELLRGCPFNVHVLNNVSGIEDNFEAEEKTNDILNLRKRKILSKTIDFIDEQIPVTDVLMTYKNKETHTSEKNKESDNNFEKKIDEVNEKKNIDELTQREPCHEKIDETEEEIEQKYEILEKPTTNFTTDNLETKANSVNENKLQTGHILNDDGQTLNIVHTVNNSSDNIGTHKAVYNDVSVQLKSTTNDDEKMDDVNDGKKQMFDFVASNLIANQNLRLSEVNKIKIPEKFCEIQKTTNKKLKNEVNTKCFKNFINASNKRETPNRDSSEILNNDITNEKARQQTNDRIMKYYENDDNNNNLMDQNRNEMKSNFLKTSPLKNSKPNIPRQLIHTPKNLEPPLHPTPTNTSPICPNHIVPEVDNEYRTMSVAEKRKIFSKKSPDRISSSSNSSFSETENAEGSPKGGHFRHFEGLSVLNYLGSLKTSQSTKKSKGYSLCSTMSLPNISSEQTNAFQNSVKERRDFWERLSTSSSSISLNSEVSFKRKPMTETERCKLIWKKPIDTPDFSSITTEDNSDFVENSEIRKSADDILSLTNVFPQNTAKKYKSMDHSLDKCLTMSIDERKRLLLKQFYEKEKPAALSKCRRVERKIVMEKPSNKRKEVDNTDTFVFTSISDRIRRFDSAHNLLNEKTSEGVKLTKKSGQADKKQNIVPSNNLRKNSQNSQNFPQPEVLTVKSHFKRAIKYFKNLEERSKTERKVGDFRKFSNRKRGGSLNLPSVTKRYFVSNLYNDIFGDRRGSFKGAANRSALVEALATFSRRENNVFKDDEDTITYEMFQKRAKIKRRRSIKSVFDVYY